MPLQRKLGAVNRAIATLLALAWLAAGAVGIAFGIAQQRWGLLVVGVLAVFYALLWSRVVARGQLLTRAALAAPWRAR